MLDAAGVADADAEAAEGAAGVEGAAEDVAAEGTAGRRGRGRMAASMDCRGSVGAAAGDETVDAAGVVRRCRAGCELDGVDAPEGQIHGPGSF